MLPILENYLDIYNDMNTNEIRKELRYLKRVYNLEPLRSLDGIDVNALEDISRYDNGTTDTIRLNILKQVFGVLVQLDDNILLRELENYNIQFLPEEVKVNLLHQMGVEQLREMYSKNIKKKEIDLLFESIPVTTTTYNSNELLDSLIYTPMLILNLINHMISSPRNKDLVIKSDFSINIKGKRHMNGYLFPVTIDIYYKLDGFQYGDVINIIYDCSGSGNISNNVAIGDWIMKCNKTTTIRRRYLTESINSETNVIIERKEFNNNLYFTYEILDPYITVFNVSKQYYITGNNSGSVYFYRLDGDLVLRGDHIDINELGDNTMKGLWNKKANRRIREINDTIQFGGIRLGNME